VTSPFYPFFAFAVLSAGFRSGLRQVVLVTAVSVALYLCLIAVSAPGNMNIYIMRPAYLAMTGYMVGYLGQQRIELQAELRQFQAAEERHRIARDLHDGFVQALAAINLRIEGCRRSLANDDAADAMSELTELQDSVNREYDALRTYMRALAGIPASPMKNASSGSTRFLLDAHISGSIDLVDHVLQIAREGISNIRRHAAAASAHRHPHAGFAAAHQHRGRRRGLRERDGAVVDRRASRKWAVSTCPQTVAPGRNCRSSCHSAEEQTHADPCHHRRRSRPVPPGSEVASSPRARRRDRGRDRPTRRSPRWYRTLRPTCCCWICRWSAARWRTSPRWSASRSSS
jgi:hypothetical protein